MQKEMALDGGTYQFIAEGASVHSRDPKTRVAEVYRYFVSKRFINQLVHCYVTG